MRIGEIMNKATRLLRMSMVLGLLHAWAGHALYAQDKTISTLVDQVVQAYGSYYGDGTIVDMMGTGMISITGGGKVKSTFTFMAKDGNKVQRTVVSPNGSVVRSGTDGTHAWQSAGLFSGKPTGMMLYFLESQGSRSFAALFKNTTHDFTFTDLTDSSQYLSAPISASRIIQAANRAGQTMRFYIDDKTFLVTRIEFDTGEYYSMPFSGQKYPAVVSFVLSDYRTVNGAMTPFKIECFQGKTKTEEINYESVQYNTGIQDAIFLP